MHLTRQQARELPSCIVTPAFDADLGLRLADGLHLPISRDGRRVTSFVPGWNPDAVSLLFYPTIILQFRHEGGGSAFWLLDAGFVYVGSTMSELGAEARGNLRRRVVSILAFLDHGDPDALACRIPDDVVSFLALSDATRQEICDGLGLTRPRFRPMPGARSRNFMLAVQTDPLGRHQVTAGERTLRLSNGRLGEDENPSALQPGWRIACLSSLFFPVLVAELCHDDGRSAYWLFDRSGQYVGDRWDQLPEPIYTILAAHAATILEDLWQDLVAHPGDRTRDHVEAFLALPAVTRDAIFDLAHSPPQPPTRTVTWCTRDPQPQATAHVAQTERGTFLLDRARIDHCLSLAVEQQNIVLANEGRFHWPSPVDGRLLAASGFALLIDDFYYAYRVQDPELGFTFYVVLFGLYVRTYALYLPGNDLLVASHSDNLLLASRYPTSRLAFLRHACNLGRSLLAGAGRPPGELYHTFRGQPLMHIGHFLWQDLCGIHLFLGGVRNDRIPRFLVPESNLGPEMFGPIDAIFPSLQGRTIRREESLNAMIPSLYEENARIIKATTLYVPRAVGSAILSAHKAAPAHRDLLARCTMARRDAEIVLLFGLRSGNRTIVDIDAFATHLIDTVCQAFPTALIVLDGQNASPGAMYRSVGDDASAPGSFLRQELETARVLAEYAGARGYRLIDNIGRPIADSLLWCDAADFFVAPWGAALAKYRWVCNKPGLVLTGRWNLEHRQDLAIYHKPEGNEAPAGIWFNAPDTAEDLVDPAQTDIASRERANFRIDPRAVAQQLVSLLRQNLTPSAARGSAMPQSWPAGG